MRKVRIDYNTEIDPIAIMTRTGLASLSDGGILNSRGICIHAGCAKGLTTTETYFSVGSGERDAAARLCR